MAWTGVIITTHGYACLSFLFSFRQARRPLVCSREIMSKLVTRELSVLHRLATNKYVHVLSTVLDSCTMDRE
jgi:hypothetical protein